MDRVSIGHSVVGWQLIGVDSASVVLERRTERMQLALWTFKSNPKPNVSNAVIGPTGEQDHADDDLSELITEELEDDHEVTRSIRPRRIHRISTHGFLVDSSFPQN